MRRIALLPLVALVGACDPPAINPPEQQHTAPAPVAAAPTPAAAPVPMLSACAAHTDEGLNERQRTDPLPLPPALAGVAASNRDSIAVVTLTGASACIDTTDMESIDTPRLLRDDRFLSFGWSGYESSGHVLFDRAGAGKQIETGDTPVFSPSGAMVAAVEYSESGFGGLNGFGLWQVLPDEVRALAVLDVPAMSSGWQIDRWVGDDCIEASAVIENGSGADAAALPRTKFAVGRANRAWRIAPGTCGTR